MHNLIYTIGPAPSELPYEDLLFKISEERNRMRRTFEHFRSNPASRKPISTKQVKPAKEPKPAKPKKITLSTLTSNNVTLSDLQSLIQSLKEAKANE